MVVGDQFGLVQAQAIPGIKQIRSGRYTDNVEQKTIMRSQFDHLPDLTGKCKRTLRHGRRIFHPLKHERR